MAKKNKRVEQAEEICIGCGICVSICPVNNKVEKKNDDFNPDTAKLAIKVYSGKAFVDQDTCIKCGSCVKICPVDSLSLIEIPTEN
ncbi:indolepyruvate ferredoxin oxidoreductase subunit alpha [Methanosalsum natronophilum]|uniref:4Fe-4S dicluster domain-containing protein n=1 Tax=Methanosalsum natronophilum TaxID=768733 RepID=A0A424Z4B6_9EURY|nr:4Fe-4S binding protein [Methanosalsum natronophilum]MCS3923090.1 4Fe-4S ferredoxin [Methanosalsum natronophilum]RQD90117.1 MAG: 4Fe-4S dicluster domain-containing protein [Methanosalsum natronophilum]